MHEKSVLTLLQRVQMFLVVHLRLEDEELYPLLEQSGNAVLSQKAKRYRARTGKLAEVFDTFCTRWTEPGAIGADPTEFVNGWGEIAGLLLSRMSSEDEDLYASGEQVLAAQLSS